MIRNNEYELPDDPNEIFDAIRNASDPDAAALGYGRELMLLTEPEKKNFWYKAELNLLVLILLLVSRGEEHLADEPSEEAALYMAFPDVTREKAQDLYVRFPAENKDIRCRLGAWCAASHGVFSNIAANLAVESEIIEYLLGRYRF